MKNILVIVLIVISIGSVVFGLMQKKEAERLASQLIVQEDQAKECIRMSGELQKMYDILAVENQVQRTLCEEQLKALRK
jgi:acetolactate synthase regulatory subunit